MGPVWVILHVGVSAPALLSFGCVQDKDMHERGAAGTFFTVSNRNMCTRGCTACLSDSICSALRKRQH